MSKRISEADLNTGDELGVFNPAISAKKLPANITAGKTPLLDFMQIPCAEIIVYQSKDDADFAPYPEEKMGQFIESIKEYGVIEPITVRVMPDGRFELLAGERRLTGAVAAGLERIPAHIYREMSESKAHSVFSITNLMRRDLSTQDKINGWWHYLKGKNGKDVQEDLESVGAIDTQAANISLRQIQRYAKMRSLISEIVEAVDAKLPQVAAYQIAFIPKDQQSDLIPYLNSITEPISKTLRALAEKNTKILAETVALLPSEHIEDLEWCARDVKRIIFPVKNASYTTSFLATAKVITKTVKQRLAPEYYNAAAAIINEALTLYFETHPDAELKKRHDVAE